MLAQGLIVSILLGPEAIGLYGIVTATAMTIVALKRVGIDEAFVQQSEQGQEEEFQRAFSLELAVSAAFSLAIAVAAPLVAIVYGEDELLPLTLAAAYMPLAFALQAPTWIFFRRMDFLRQRLLLAVGPVVTFVFTVGLAAAGVGVWSLVIGPAIGNAAAAAGGRGGFALPAATCASSATPRGATSASPGRSSCRARRCSSLLQGQLLAFDVWGGIAAVGHLTLAYTLTRYADRADHVVASTIYPAICAVRDQVDDARGDLRQVEPGRDDLVGPVLRRHRPVRAGPRGVRARATSGSRRWCCSRASPWPPRSSSSASTGSRSTARAATRARRPWRRASWRSLSSRSRVPGLALWGATGFVVGRGLVSLAMLVVRGSLRAPAAPGRAAVGARRARGRCRWLAGAAAALALRLALWGGERPLWQVLCELALFLAVTALATRALERDLLREFTRYLRTGNLTPAAA